MSDMQTQRVDRAIAALAARQHGVVAWWQLRAIGVTRSQVDVRIASGRLHRIHHGVYAVGHPVLTIAGRRLAAVLALGPGAVLSHRSAAEHRGFLPPTGGALHVTVPGPAGRRPRTGIRVHRAAVEPAVHDGVPITTVARTLVDVAATESRPVLDRAIKAAERARVFDLRAIEPLMVPRRRGVGALRAALGAWHDAPTRSELEEAFLRLCRRHGLPRPAVNTLVEGFLVDFVWHDARLIVETDGDWHATRDGLHTDRRRDLAHTLAGYRTLRFTWPQVRDDDADVGLAVRRTYEERAALR